MSEQQPVAHFVLKILPYRTELENWPEDLSWCSPIVHAARSLWTWICEARSVGGQVFHYHIRLRAERLNGLFVVFVNVRVQAVRGFGFKLRFPGSPVS